MNTALLVAFNLRNWCGESVYELLTYFNRLDGTQWGIVSACAVLFGFMCMRSNDVRNL